MTLTSHHNGALELLTIEDLSALIEIAPQQQLALDILSYALINSTSGAGDIAVSKKSIDDITSALSVSFKDTDGVTLLSFLGTTLPKLDPEVCLARAVYVSNFDHS